MHKGEEGGNGRSLSVVCVFVCLSVRLFYFVWRNDVYIFNFVSVLSVCQKTRMTAIKTILVGIYSEEKQTVRNKGI